MFVAGPHTRVGSGLTRSSKTPARARYAAASRGRRLHVFGFEEPACNLPSLVICVKRFTRGCPLGLACHTLEVHADTVTHAVCCPTMGRLSRFLGGARYPTTYLRCEVQYARGPEGHHRQGRWTGGPSLERVNRSGRLSFCCAHGEKQKGATNTHTRAQQRGTPTLWNGRCGSWAPRGAHALLCVSRTHWAAALAFTQRSAPGPPCDHDPPPRPVSLRLRR